MSEVRIIVAGGRDYNDYDDLRNNLDFIISHHCKGYNKITIVSGAARGTDKMGERYAKEKSLNLKIIPAEWFKLGKSAGIIRNKQMADYSISDDAKGVLVAFWNGKSKGTKNMIDTAMSTKKIDVHIVDCNYEKSEK